MDDYLHHKDCVVEMKSKLFVVLNYLHDQTYCEKSEAIETAIKLLEFMDEYENMK